MDVQLPSLFHEMSEFSKLKAFTADFELQHYLRRELESLARGHLPEATVLAGFGRLSEFLAHRKTYDSIADEIEGVYIFAQNDAEWTGQSDRLHYIELPPDSLMGEEPFFLVISRKVSAGMISRAISEKTKHVDPLPDYDVLLSFDPGWVGTAVRVLKEIVPETPSKNPPLTPDEQEKALTLTIAGMINHLAKSIGAMRQDYNVLLKQFDALSAAAKSDTGQDPESWLLATDHFMERLDQTIQLARRHDQPLSLLTVAVDRVEPGVNPEALRALGAAINSVSRSTDIIGHIRQGIIAVGSPLTDRKGAQVFEARLRNRLEKLAEDFEGGELTIGIATRDMDGTHTAEDLLVYAEIDRLKADSDPEAPDS